MTCATCGAKSRLSKAREFTKYSSKRCHKIFASGFFHESSSPKLLKNLIRVISNFFENLLRYSQVKVHHQYQRHRWQIYYWYEQHRRQILPPVPLMMLIPVAKLLPVSTILAANFPSVSTTPVVHLQISPQSFGKI
jgi:hypothetical protein